MNQLQIKANMKGKIFNAQEVQAIISGNKTQFRRVVANQVWFGDFLQTAGDGFLNDIDELIKDFCPYQVGQKIFCKEKFIERNEGIYYAGTDFSKGYLKYHPWSLPQHMKQEHSRLTLLIKKIRVERLGEISNADCRNEGEDQWSFICNWNATHKKPEEKFEANPWVWVVEFEVVEN